MLALIDTHCHLADARLRGDTGELLTRARAAGVRQVVAVGASGGIETDRETVAIAQAHAEVHAAIGVHPHDASQCDAARLAQLRELAGHSKVVAIGETGMDLHYLHSTAEQQQHSLRAHLRLAAELGLPVVIHCREAETAIAAIVREEGMPAAGGVIHCFSGDRRAAEQFLSLGFYLSYSGIVTFKNAAELRETVPMVPEERLLVETDAPYLTPVPHRGKRNEPALVALTAQTVAHLRGVAPEELSPRMSANAIRLFRLPPSTAVGCSQA